MKMHLPTVLVYRRKLLEFSETFIKRQVQSLNRWDAFLAGRPLGDGLPLDGLCVIPLELPDPNAKLPAPSPFRRIHRILMRRRRHYPTPIERAKVTADYIRKQPWFSKLEKASPRLLHVHFGTNAQEAWPLANALNIPMVVTLHGYDASIYPDWWESGRKGIRYKEYPRALREMQENGVSFIAVSEDLRELATQYGLRSSAIRKILIGVDTKKLVPNGISIIDRPKRVLFVGRFVEKKGIEHLIRAFVGLKDRLPDAELRIIGDGHLEDELRVLAEGHGIDFRGRLSSRAVLDEMGQARVLCVPSVRAKNGDSEGLPTVIAEAQALGLPVVTSAIGGATEGIRDGVTGISFPEGDTASLGYALIRLLADDAFAASASLAARHFAEECLDVHMQTRYLEKFYDEIILSQ